jgi:hypothetical protein
MKVFEECEHNLIKSLMINKMSNNNKINISLKQDLKAGHIQRKLSV